MKKLLSLLLATVLFFSLPACTVSPGHEPSSSTKLPTHASSPTDIWNNYDTITIAQALKICEDHVSAPSSSWYYVIAKIDSVDDASYGQFTISDSTSSIMVYCSYSNDGTVRYGQMSQKPVAGDYVLLYGCLQNYKGSTKEFNKAYIIDYIPIGGHVPQPPVTSELTYISDRRVQYNEADEQYVIFFGLQDQNKNYMDGSGTAEITIKDSNGNILYSQNILFTSSDFTSWTNTTWDNSRYLCGLFIDRSDIQGSTSTSGTLSLKVIMNDGVWFDAYNCSISSLPEKSVHIVLPTLPTEVAYNSYDCVNILTIKNITYTSSLNYDGSASVTFTILVTLTAKSSDKNESSSTQIGYKLYDSDGVVVDSGTIYVTPLAEGETARETENIYDLNPNETYTLVLMNSK